MRPLSLFGVAENNRRVAAAQMILWVACLAPILVFVLVSMEIVLGHPERIADLDVSPAEAAVHVIWLALYGVAAYFVGARRPLGGILGLALFGRTVAVGVIDGRPLTLNVAFAVVGIALILRAGRALRLPLFPG